jgi:hypothetical protein
MAYYDSFYDQNYFEDEQQDYFFEIETPWNVPEYIPQQRWLDSVHTRMALILLAVVVIVSSLAFLRPAVTATSVASGVATVVANAAPVLPVILPLK